MLGFFRLKYINKYTTILWWKQTRLRLSLCYSPFILLWENLIQYRIFQTCRCFLPSFGSFGWAVSEEIFFRYRPIRNKNCLWWPCLLTDRDEMSNLHRGHSIDASCYVSVNLAKRFQRRFLKIGQSETRIACGGPCLVMDHNKMCTL